ncbi:MAG: PDZ domain-containing protein [Anaerolineaceae bacterium]|nr:PDZ domain-containing protein [Anaerolineaceae bacterium]
MTPTVISVFRVNDRTKQLSPGTGSGVIISSDGYALTNFHVTRKTPNLRVGRPGGKVLEARLCGLDRTGDIALIKIDSDEPLPFAPLGSSDALQVGQWVIAMGNPFMLATDFRPTVSLGVVSGLQRYLPGGGLLRQNLIYADAIQIDAALNPGNSGGPLFNMQGQLVGINGRIAARRVRGMSWRRINAGIGFAVPIDSIKMFLDDLKAGHEVDRGYLGVYETDLKDGGLMIKSIRDESPAEIFGLKEGDVLLQLDGRRIQGPGQLRNFVQTRPAGRRVKISLRRDGKVMTRTVQLGGIQSVAALRIAERAAGTSPPKANDDQDEGADKDRDDGDQDQGEPEKDEPDQDDTEKQSPEQQDEPQENQEPDQ